MINACCKVGKLTWKAWGFIILHLEPSCFGLIGHKRWWREKTQAKGAVGNNRHDTFWDDTQTSWHPAAWLLPLASLSDGLNSFLFSGDSGSAATSCLGCLQCLFVVTWNTCEKSSGPCVTRAKHEGEAQLLNLDFYTFFFFFFDVTHSPATCLRMENLAKASL